MSTQRSLVRWAAALAVAATTGCAKPALPPIDRGSDLVVLLPDPGSDAVGRASVSNRRGSVDLTEAGDFTTVVASNGGPAAVLHMKESNVRDIFGEALSALPPPPQTFTLFFRFDSEELTDESRKLAADVLRSVKKRPFPDIGVLGHTDTMGSRRRNFELGLKRANTVRALLIEIGLDPSAIQVGSHGEDELLVRTGDEVFEPRNRRVEIMVR